MASCHIAVIPPRGLGGIRAKIRQPVRVIRRVHQAKSGSHEGATLLYPHKSNDINGLTARECRQLPYSSSVDQNVGTIVNDINDLGC
jgi:hypothetical protein